MAVKKVGYVSLKVPSRKGQAVGVLGPLAEAGVDLLAFTGFPEGRGRAQVDLVTNDLAGVRRVARREGWRISDRKRAFLAQGRDQVGAVNRELSRLADAGINVTAADAVSAGQGRYGMILWVKPKDYAKAARALRAR